MEAKKRLQKDLKLVEKDIKRLKKRKKNIEKQLTDMASNFKEKFQIWYSNGKRGHYPWRPSNEDDFPYISKHLERSCEVRNKVYDLTHLLGEEVLGLFEGDDYREYYDSEEEYQADILKYTSAWFDYSVQKMTSVSASLATAKFNQLRLLRATQPVLGNIADVAPMIDSESIKAIELGMFDSRVFQVPTLDEMVNTLIFRQQDCTRNSVSMVADALLKGSMEGVKNQVKQERLFQEAGVNWNDYKTKYKRGSVIKKIEVENNGVIRNRWVIDNETPIFTQDKQYLIDFMPK